MSTHTFRRTALHSRLVASAICLASHAIAQTPTVQARVVQELRVEALGNIFPTGSTQPLGTLPPGSTTLTDASLTSFVSMTVGSVPGLPAGVTGFRWSSSGQASGGYFEPSGFFASGAIALQLSMPTPTPFLVVVQGQANSQYASTSTRVDIGDDSVVDLELTGGSAYAEFGLLVGPTGASVRLAHGSVGTGINPSSAHSSLTLTFYPRNAPLARYGTSCETLTWTRGPDGAARLACPASSGSLAVFAWGTQALQLQLPPPFASGCLLLTDVDGLWFAIPHGGSANLQLPNFAPPHGVSIHLQAATIDASLVLRTTNGLVMTGP